MSLVKKNHFVLLILKKLQYLLIDVNTIYNSQNPRVILKLTDLILIGFWS